MIALAQHQNLPLELIDYDTTNPRIVKTLAIYGGNINQARIALALAESAEDSALDGKAADTFTRLRNSIIDNGGISNPIIVVKQGDRFLCVEGNTRLSIYFSEYEKKQGDASQAIWAKIPAMVHETNLQDSETGHLIRLQAHLIGPRPWTPHAKAAYLYRLHHEEGYSISRLSEMSGMQEGVVEHHLKAYVSYGKFEQLYDEPQDADVKRFSAFIEFHKNATIIPTIERAGFDETDFAKWVRADRFSVLAHVRKLPQIIANKKARDTFLKYNSLEAIRVLDPDPQKPEGDLMTQIRATIDSALSLEYDELVKLATSEKAEEYSQDIEECIQALVSLREDMQAQKE